VLFMSVLLARLLPCFSNVPSSVFLLSVTV
jgi:hypothetical protein